jgi:LmbE family N-acetylglucosaminyl deacetylase
MLFKPLLRKIRNAVMALVEQLWALGFALAGRIMRPAVAGWSSPGAQRVLAVAPHPDDEACGCAGTLVRHKRCGDVVCIAFVTDGRRSRALGLVPEEMARRRRQEAEASAAALGADRVEWFGLPEGEWAAAQLQPRLSALIREFAPDIVYAPSRIDFHPEHYQVAYTLGPLLADSDNAPRVRVYQVQVPLTAALANLVVDISSVVAESAAALNTYVTQRGSVARTFRMRRYGASFYGLKRQAEEFWELPADHYRTLHVTPPERWSSRTFRSLRFYPWSDPLAYIWGRAARRQVARLVGVADGSRKTHGWNDSISS